MMKNAETLFFSSNLRECDYHHSRLPLLQCAEHGIKAVDAPWDSSGSSFTLLFEALDQASRSNESIGKIPDAIAI